MVRRIEGKISVQRINRLFMINLTVIEVKNDLRRHFPFTAVQNFRVTEAEYIRLMNLLTTFKGIQGANNGRIK